MPTRDVIFFVGFFVDVKNMMYMAKRKIFNVMLLIILAVLSAWVYDRWNVWFGMRVESVYEVSEEPHHVQLTFGYNGAEERIVSWRMAQLDTTIRLKYVNNAVGDTIEVKPVVVEFNNDSVSAVYYRAVIPVGQLGLYAYSVGNCWYEFEVREQSEFRVLCFGDMQYKQAQLRLKIDSIVDFVKPDFIVHAGDLVERPFLKYWDVYFDDFNNVAPRIPMLVVLGNHDYHRFPNKYPDPRFLYVFPYFNNGKTDVEEPSNYELAYGGVNFYLFDSNRFYPQLRKQANNFGKNKESGGDRYSVAVLHHPPHSAKSRWNNIDVKLAFASVFEEKGIDLVLAGHEHVYQYIRSGERSYPYGQYVSHFSLKNYSKTQVENKTFAVLEYKNEVLECRVYNEKFELILCDVVENIR